MERISGKYFDGLSSKSNIVEVELDYKFLIINGESINTVWTVNEVKNVDFSSAKEINLHYGNKPQEGLIISGKENLDKLRIKYPELFNQNVYSRILKGNNTKVFLFSIFVLIAVLLSYLVFIGPFVAEKAVDIVSVEQEVQLGNKMFESMEEMLDLNDEKSRELNDFYHSLGFKNIFPVKLYYSNSKDVNAFAIPGGKIVVHKGIIDKMDRWEQLAGLISHEFVHVERRHSLKSLSRNLSTYIVFSVITTDISGITSVFIENALKLNNLSNSRNFEQEADDLGYELLVENDIDPKGILELFDILDSQSKDLSENANKVLKILSTHPLTQDRIKNVKDKLLDYKGTPVENADAKSLFMKLKTEIDE